MIHGIVVQDGHEMTQQTVLSLAQTVADPQAFRLVIVDNASVAPYTPDELGALPFAVEIVRLEKNLGFYRPLKELHDRYTDELLTIAHNDVFYYEHGWDRRVTKAFAQDPKLGLVGACGSYEIDGHGGRGSGTMCFFRGQRGQSQAAGMRLTTLRASVVLDSLYMCFRRGAVVDLHETWERLPLGHFYDKIWPCRLIEAGWRVATLGFQIDHVGGTTMVGNQRYADECRQWFEDTAIAPDPRAVKGHGVNYEHAMYLEAENRFLREYRDEKKFFPCSVTTTYAIRR